ncbi:NAD(P)-dependent oxidoreductase [Azotobacter beijerinckii]|uniref:NAD(P)-dependent oxidoreductase n=1 Tax=Azotobacter beijerinckii TaxID=170623 RepID=UPI002676EB22|nr:NAD(P)-dependent oxidoreductase [Azotobacter beijerinckii]
MQVGPFSFAGRYTYHAIDAAVLQALGPQGFLINVSRGTTVDEKALLDALKTGQIAGAGLDVYEHEPSIPGELFELPHVALTPHIGGSTLEAAQEQEACVLANIEAFTAGQPPHTPVPL